MQQIIDLGQYTYYPRQKLGQGATGAVYRGHRNHDKIPIAVKVIRLREIDSARKKQLLDYQVLALRNINHKYVAQTFDVLQDTQNYYIPMQFCPNGTLKDYIRVKKLLPEQQALRLFECILEGYSHIASCGFMHRDLKTQNILLRGNMEPAIIDFGYCATNETQFQRLSYNVGSPAYMSPQAYNTNTYCQKSDVWALGVILHEMVTGTIPTMRTFNVDKYFQDLANMQTAEIVIKSQSHLCMSLLQSALTVNIHQRASAQQLLQMIRNPMQNQSPTISNTANYMYSPTNTPIRKRRNSMKQLMPIRQISQRVNTLQSQSQGNQSWTQSPLQRKNQQILQNCQFQKLNDYEKNSVKSHYHITNFSNLRNRLTRPQPLNIKQEFHPQSHNNVYFPNKNLQYQNFQPCSPQTASKVLNRTSPHFNNVSPTLSPYSGHKLYRIPQNKKQFTLQLRKI